MAGRGRSVAMAGVLMCCCVSAVAQLDVDNRGIAVDPSGKMNPEFKRTLEERSREELERAVKEGRSHIQSVHGEFPAATEGTPEGMELGSQPRIRVQGQTVDPAAAAGATEAGAAKQPEPKQAAASVERVPRESYEALDATKESELPALIAELLKAWNRPPQMVRLKGSEAAVGGGRGVEAVGRESATVVRRGARWPGVKAGEGLYARVLYSVNSDYPGPVLMEILEAPLSGAVASGGFERVGERLVVRLDGLSWRGQRTEIDGWAVGLDCACFGLQGDVDRHWWDRLVLPAAVRFAEGFLIARGQAGRTVEVSGETVIDERGAPTERQAIFTGLGDAVRSVGQILLQEAPTGPTVRIPRDAEVAVVFARPPGEGASSVVRSVVPQSRRPTGSAPAPAAAAAVAPGEVGR